MLLTCEKRLVYKYRDNIHLFGQFSCINW